jgi:predicted ATPase
MEGARLIQKLRLTNILSYGPEGEEIELEPLNVLIGPNGSGKSNLIEAIGLLRAAPNDIAAPLRVGGGVSEWIHKRSSGPASDVFGVDAWVTYPGLESPLVHAMRLRRIGQQVAVEEENVTCESVPEGADPERYWYYRQSPTLTAVNSAELILSGHAVGPLPAGAVPPRRARELGPKERSSARSILAQLRDPTSYPELTHLAQVYSQIGLFRAASVGPNSPLRGPQGAAEPISFLREDGANLALVLNDRLARPAARKWLLKELRRFYERVEDVTTRTYAGTIEILFHERGLEEPVTSSRLSDGTLRYLSLLCVLSDPSPPPLVCIEEPEIGLHPDALPHIAELLVEASERMQLIVTTHSDILVSALSDVPEAVVVCERDDGGTHLRRLDPEAMKEWLEDYSLGGLWRMGELGGNP